jgi:hypothetical protein
MAAQLSSEGQRMGDQKAVMEAPQACIHLHFVDGSRDVG